jgi:uncharacterized SAM-binding protein YcdF (DUF218 family)
MELSPFLFGLYKLAKYAVYPTTWLLLLLGLLIGLAAGPLSPKRLQWIRRLAVSAALLVFIGANPLLAHTLVGLIEAQAPPFDGRTAKPFDAIVVLSAGAVSKGTLRPSDELSPFSIQRTVCGADLFHQGLAPHILFAGGDASIFGSGPEEGAVMKKLALRLGVPDEAALVENRSRTTYESAVETKRILGQASILLVTSAHHVPRALALFRKQGLETVASPCGYLTQDRPGDGWNDNSFYLLPDVEALRRSTLAINEIVGILLYRASGKL